MCKKDKDGLFCEKNLWNIAKLCSSEKNLNLKKT